MVGSAHPTTNTPDKCKFELLAIEEVSKIVARELNYPRTLK
jgi:hypothetical protein